jgi:hypothetical protein
LRYVEDYRSRAGTTVETGNAHRTRTSDQQKLPDQRRDVTSEREPTT